MKNKYLLIGLGIVIIAIVVVLGIKHKATSTPLPVACTLEAKICPDGSSVSRVGPSCEFAECPAAKAEPVKVTNVQPDTNPTPSPVVPKKIDTGLLIGHITLSPTCPVETDPPTPECAPKPYSAIVQIVGGKYSVEIHADAKGYIRVPLAVGSYTVTPHSGSVYPRCETQPAIITKNATTTLEISCDSGIR